MAKTNLEAICVSVTRLSWGNCFESSETCYFRFLEYVVVFLLCYDEFGKFAERLMCLSRCSFISYSPHVYL